MRHGAIREPRDATDPTTAADATGATDVIGAADAMNASDAIGGTDAMDATGDADAITSTDALRVLDPDLPPELAHWHAVLTADELGDTPRRVRLCGRDIAVFRTASGQIGALDDACPHRRMALSAGRVDGDRLVCRYHGWAFETDGAGHSPGNPRLRPCARHYDAVRRHGVIWLRAAGAATTFPALDVAALTPICQRRVRVRAPLELVLDNFIEVEHTGTTHALLGYDTARMDEVVTEVTAHADAIDVYNRGPQKPLPAPIRRLFGIGPDDTFVDAWTTRFSPVNAVYDHFWLTPAGDRRPLLLRSAVFLTPVDADTTDLVVLSYASAHPLSRIGLGWLVHAVARRLVDREIELDRRMIEQIADKSTALRGMKLGRFDRPLGLARKRIRSIYRRGRSADGPADGSAGRSGRSGG